MYVRTTADEERGHSFLCSDMFSVLLSQVVYFTYSLRLLSYYYSACLVSSVLTQICGFSTASSSGVVGSRTMDATRFREMGVLGTLPRCLAPGSGAPRLSPPGTAPCFLETHSRSIRCQLQQIQEPSDVEAGV